MVSLGGVQREFQALFYRKYHTSRVLFFQIKLSGFEKFARLVDHICNDVHFNLRIHMVIAKETRILSLDKPAMKFLIQ